MANIFIKARNLMLGRKQSMVKTIMGSRSSGFTLNGEVLRYSLTQVEFMYLQHIVFSRDYIQD